MTALYIINLIVLIVTTVALILHFLVIKKQRELTDMNNIVLGMNSLFTKGKLICREPDCSTRGISVHTAISNNEPILVIDLFKDSKKDEKIDELNKMLVARLENLRGVERTTDEIIKKKDAEIEQLKKTIEELKHDF